VTNQPNTAGNADVVERLARVRAILPLMASDLAAARRRSNALEIENRRLTRRVVELESLLASAPLPRDTGHRRERRVAARAA
jgi:hypothetical protein